MSGWRAWEVRCERPGQESGLRAASISPAGYLNCPGGCPEPQDRVLGGQASSAGLEGCPGAWGCGGAGESTPRPGRGPSVPFSGWRPHGQLLPLSAREGQGEGAVSQAQGRLSRAPPPSGRTAMNLCVSLSRFSDWPSESKSPLVTQAFPIALLSILYPQHRECFTSYLELIGNPFIVSLHGY